MMIVKNNPIVPKHYTKGGMDILDFMKIKMSKEEVVGFLRGNVLKYTFRYKDKGGIEDLKKAQWYLTELIEWEEKQFPKIKPIKYGLGVNI